MPTILNSNAATKKELREVAYPNAVWVDDYGAVGDGIADDWAAFDSALTAAGNGGVLALTPKKTYLTRSPIGQSRGAGSFAGMPALILGNGATIKAPNEVTSLTTTVINVGTTSVGVTTGTGVNFFVGLYVCFRSADSNSSTYAVKITAIATDTLTVEAITFGAGTTIAVGGSVSDTGSVLWFSNNNITERKGVTFKNIIFDGNVDNRTTIRNWTGVECVHVNYFTDVNVLECIFQNIPGEGIIFLDGFDISIRHCRFENIFGNGVHPGGTGVFRNFSVTDSIFKNVFQATTSTTPTAIQYGHQGACIETSTGPQRTLISGNIFDTSNGYGTGQFNGSTNSNAVVSNNIYNACRWGAWYFTSGSRNITCTGNLVISCGLDQVESGITPTTRIAGSSGNASIIGNTFYDSALAVDSGGGRTVVSGNSFDVSVSARGTGFREAALIVSNANSETLVEGNYIVAGTGNVSTNFRGIFTYGTAISIKNNLIKGGDIGIRVGGQGTYMDISGNMLYDQRTSGTALGISLPTGVLYTGIIISDNTIIIPAASTNVASTGIDLGSGSMTFAQCIFSNNLIRNELATGTQKGISSLSTAGGAGLTIRDNTISMGAAGHQAIDFSTAAVAGCHVLGNRFIQGITEGILATDTPVGAATVVYSTTNSNFNG